LAPADPYAIPKPGFSEHTFIKLKKLGQSEAIPPVFRVLFAKIISTPICGRDKFQPGLRLVVSSSGKFADVRH